MTEETVGKYLLLPSHVARPEAVPPGHPDGALLPLPATPGQHQPTLRGAVLHLAAGRCGALGVRQAPLGEG